MKIKTDFVTNSSSVNYIISSPNCFDENDFDIIPTHAMEEIICFTEIEKLITYTQSDKCDWVTKIRGPYRYWRMTQEWYDICKRIIKKGEVAIHIDMDRNYSEEIDKMKQILYEAGATIVVEQND